MLTARHQPISTAFTTQPVYAGFALPKPPAVNGQIVDLRERDDEALGGAFFWHIDGL
jgi:hypothetical protein